MKQLTVTSILLDAFMYPLVNIGYVEFSHWQFEDLDQHLVELHLNSHLNHHV